MGREIQVLEVLDVNMKKILIIITEVNSIEDWDKILEARLEKDEADFKILIEVKSDFFSDQGIGKNIPAEDFFDSIIMVSNLEVASSIVNEAKTILTPKGLLDSNSKELVFLGWIGSSGMWGKITGTEVFFREIEDAAVYLYIKKEKKESTNGIEDLEIFLPTTILNIEKAITLKEIITSQEDFNRRELRMKSFPYARSYMGDFFNIFNLSLDEFLNFENLSKYALSLENSNLFFLVIESSQIEKIGLNSFKDILQKLADKKVITKKYLDTVILPIIIDPEISICEESDKYSDILTSHFICKNSEEAKKAIEGILHFSTEQQWYPFQILPGFFENFFHFYKSGRILFEIYEGDYKDFDIPLFLKELKCSKPKDYLVNVITNDWMGSHSLGDYGKLMGDMDEYLETDPESPICCGFINDFPNFKKGKGVLIIAYSSDSLYS